MLSIGRVQHHDIYVVAASCQPSNPAKSGHIQQQSRFFTTLPACASTSKIEETAMSKTAALSETATVNFKYQWETACSRSYVRLSASFL